MDSQWSTNVKKVLNKNVFEAHNDYEYLIVVRQNSKQKKYRFFIFL